MKSILLCLGIVVTILSSTIKLHAQDLSNDPCLQPRFWFKGHEKQSSIKASDISKLENITIYLNSGCRTIKPRVQLHTFRFSCARGYFGDSGCHGIELSAIGEEMAVYELEPGDKFTISIFADIYTGDYSFEYISLTKEFTVI